MPQKEAAAVSMSLVEDVLPLTGAHTHTHNFSIHTTSLRTIVRRKRT